MRPLHSKAGQGTTEMLFLIPLFTILAAGAISITYICWQGLKVQQAANAAARMAGQETVGGAKDSTTLLEDNGLLNSLNVRTQGDPDPQAQNCGGLSDPQAQADCYKNLSPGGLSTGSGVYWRYRDMVRSLFNAGEQKQLYVPPPKINDYVSQVKVGRVMQAPKVFGWQMQKITVESTAYGGEDSFMYGLPRFGRTSSSDPAGKNTFWQGQFQNLSQNPSVKNDTTGQ